MASPKLTQEGCSVYPVCLTCQLPVCALENRDGNAEIITAFEQEGLTAKALAARFGMSERNMYKILKKCRDGKK